MSLHREMLYGRMLFPVIGQRLVEGRVLLLCYLLGVSHPDRLLLIEVGPLVADFLDLFGLLFLLLDNIWKEPKDKLWSS